MIPSHNRRRRCSLQVPILHNFSSNISNNSSGEILKKSNNSPTKSGCSGYGDTGSLKKKMYSQKDLEYNLGVKVRKMKIDLNIYGTWRRVRQ